MQGIVKDKDIQALKNGIILEDGMTSPAKVEIIKFFDNSTVLQLKIYEGRKRQIRRMCAAIGHPIINLKRIEIGNLSLNGLKVGQWRYLNREEINYIKKIKGERNLDYHKKSNSK